MEEPMYKFIVAATFLFFSCFNLDNAISDTTKKTDLVILNRTFTQQAIWRHEIPNSFNVNKANIKIVGSSAEWGSETYKLWIWITDDGTSNIGSGMDPPFFVTTLILKNFDTILTTKELNETHIEWLNQDGDIYVHLFTTTEEDTVKPGRFNFEINASRLSAEGIEKSSIVPSIPLLLLDE
jgi:hypothetical protein